MRRRGVSRTVTRLALVLLALASATAETTLVVRVVDPLGEPLHGVAVDLQRPDQPVDRVKLTPRTGRDGRVRFFDLQAGTYGVSIRRFPGWGGEAFESVEITGRTETVERRLTPTQARTYPVTGMVENFAVERFGQPALFLQEVERAAPPTPPGECLAALIRPDGSFRIRAPHAGEYAIYIDELSSGSRGCTGLRPTPETAWIGDDVDDLHLEPPPGFARRPAERPLP